MSFELPASLRARLRDVRSVRVITGAGISADSGIPTYRGPQGLYNDPDQGQRVMRALSATGLASEPDETWRHVAQLAEQIKDCRPNPAHYALAEMERARPDTFVLTQNVDGLHQAAGSGNVIEIHGNLRNALCLECGRVAQHTLAEVAAFVGTPRCTACDGALRPGVVLFDEMLGLGDSSAMRRHFVERTCDLVLVIGTSGGFPYIQLPVRLAHEASRLVVEVNPEPTSLSHLATHHLRGSASECLPVLAAAFVR